MDYWDWRKLAAGLIPRQTRLEIKRTHVDAVREKGRKSGYHQYHLGTREMTKQERLLNADTVNSFLEISCRAQACPLPLNMDVWDGLICPFACRYCYANAFRASLYTAFFDNSKTMGFRHCNPEHYKTELDKLMAFRGKDPHSINSDIRKAIAMDIPIRFGIRFEDFLKEEKKAKISLQMLQYLASQGYPVMINTKSDLVGEEEYVGALASNKGKAAVHITMISCRDELLGAIEPGAPTFERRLQAAKNLTKEGVRVVARIEPYLMFVNDKREDVEEYMERVWGAGIRNITFDTYSYTANNPGIRQAFINEGIDFERLFTMGADSQALGSFMLNKFMGEFQKYGFSTSSFDMGCVPSNDQAVCCEVGDWFEGGFNYGSTVYASRYIVAQKGREVSWKMYQKWVNKMGGFLSPALELAVKELWNIAGQDAYSHVWSQGLTPCGTDEDGLVWKYEAGHDFRKDIFEAALGRTI